MKRFLLLLPLLALLAGCGEKTLARAETLQQRYAALSGYAAETRVAVAREEETLLYELALSSEEGNVRVEVTAPQELAGIAATLSDDEATFFFDGTVFDAVSVRQDVSALNCAYLLLKAFPETYLSGCGTETFSGTEALRADFSLTLAGEMLPCTLWFAADGAPIYGEIAENGKIIAAVEFTSFTFGAILPLDA